MRYSREATTRLAPGQPLVFTAQGVFKSAPVVENAEVAAATGGKGGHSDSDVNSRPDRK